VIGLDESSFYRWLRRGQRAISEEMTDASEVPYRILAEGVEIAAAEGEAHLVRKLEAATSGGAVVSRKFGRDDEVVAKTRTAPDWRGFAWILERRFGWRRHETVALDSTRETGVSAQDVLADPVATQLVCALEERLAGLDSQGNE
jgi:hypothetical protein